MHKLAARRGWMMVCCAVGGAGSAAAQTEPHQDFVCVRGSVTRIVSVYNQPGSDAQSRGRCRVDYTKDGSTTTVWSASTGHGYCATKAAALVTRLNEGGFSCKPETVEAPDPEDAASPPAATPPG